MRLLLAAFCLTASSAVAGDDAASPDLMPEYYDTELEAAVAGVQLSYERSNAYEYAGVVVRTTNGKFRVSRPDTDYRGDGVSIDFENDFAGYDIVADYHTHPCLPYSHWPSVFSDGDADSNDHRAIVGYMGDFCSGVVRRYVPGVTERDVCWQRNPAVEALARIESVSVCGAHGEAVDTIRITKRPVLQETPGPKTKARGMNGW